MKELIKKIAKALADFHQHSQTFGRDERLAVVQSMDEPTRILIQAGATQKQINEVREKLRQTPMDYLHFAKMCVLCDLDIEKALERSLWKRGREDLDFIDKCYRIRIKSAGSLAMSARPKMFLILFLLSFGAMAQSIKKKPSTKQIQTNKMSIEQKLREVIEMAKVEGDESTRIILHALLGAKASRMDMAYAAHSQKFVKEVLLPDAERKKEAQKK